MPSNNYLSPKAPFKTPNPTKKLCLKQGNHSALLIRISNHFFTVEVENSSKSSYCQYRVTSLNKERNVNDASRINLNFPKECALKTKI